MTVRITLFQPIDSPVRDHEFTSFVNKFGSDIEVRQVDVIHDDLEAPSWYVTHSDALVIGGSPYSMTDDSILQAKEFLVDVLQGAYAQSLPVLGVCFGHQVLASAFGGKVEQDIARHQKGFARVYRSKKAGEDPLMNFLPESFVVRLNHKDHVVQLPEDAELLLYNHVSEVQGFRLKDRMMYGVQFHPEISLEDVRYRYMHFGDQYFLNAEEQQERLEDLIPADEHCALLLQKFIDLVRDCVQQKT